MKGGGENGREWKQESKKEGEDKELSTSCNFVQSKHISSGNVAEKERLTVTV